MTQNRLTGIDFLRVLSMFGVILIHVTSTYIYNESHYHVLGMNPAFFLNQAARFSVPLFILLSGFSLGIGQKQESYPSFLKRRCSRILLPYVVWTLLYELSNCGFDFRAWLSRLGHPLWLLQEFLTGQAAPHLYFIPIIFQFYLLYPLLRRWVDRRPLQSVTWALSVTFLFQGIYYLQSLGLIPGFQNHYLWRAFPVWIFYFVMGMGLQRLDLEKIRIRCKEAAAPLLVTCLLFVCLYCFLSSYTGALDSIKPSIMLFVPLVFFCGVAVWERFSPRPRLKAAVAFLSMWSMDIYYSHVMILCLLRMVPRFQDGMSGMLLLFLATVLVSVLFAAFLDLGRKRLRFHMGESA